MGITPKGQQDRRWERPQPPKPAPSWSRGSGLRRLRVTDDDPYAHLRVTDERLTTRERYDLRTYGTPEPTAKERLAVLEGKVVARRG